MTTTSPAGEIELALTTPWSVVYVYDWLVGVDLAVTNLEVEMTVGIRTDPGLEMNGRALTAEIREWHEVSVATASTLGEPRSYFFHNHNLTLVLPIAQSRNQFSPNDCCLSRTNSRVSRLGRYVLRRCC